MQYGHFDNEKREYVIDRVDLPVSWTNYLGVKDMCAVLNHTAGGYLFYQSPGITGSRDFGEMQSRWIVRDIMYM